MLLVIYFIFNNLYHLFFVLFKLDNFWFFNNVCLLTRGFLLLNCWLLFLNHNSLKAGVFWINWVNYFHFEILIICDFYLFISPIVVFFIKFQIRINWFKCLLFWLANLRIHIPLLFFILRWLLTIITSIVITIIVGLILSRLDFVLSQSIKDVWFHENRLHSQV